MAALTTPVCQIGWKAANFRLPDPDGRVYGLTDIAGANGTLVMFICNHCPYVRAIAPRISREASELQAKHIGVVAIMPNDYLNYLDDAPERMRQFAHDHGFTFPYLIDETQETARAYDAVCTPDFFGFNSALELQYRGRLDASRMEAVPGARRELYEAMCQIAETGRGPEHQLASMGCSIKWRQDCV